MTRLSLLTVILCASIARITLAAPLPAEPAPATPAAWRQAALADIKEAYQITVENHAGTYDPYNPGFIANLNQAEKHSLDLADRVRDSAGYIAVLADFTAGIHDGHAGVSSQLPSAQAPTERWPGFVTVWRRDALYVYAALPGGPAAGAQVISCDGMPIDDIIRSNVFAFKGKVEDAGDWWFRAPRVFVDNGNPFAKVPSMCKFALGGVETNQALHWDASTTQAKQWRDESFNGDTLPVGLSEPAKGVYWAAMPSFTPDEPQRAAYRAMTHEISTNRDQYLNARAVVIDLRGNFGGNSSWSADFAGALWGEERVQTLSKTLDAKTQVWWRASAQNTAYMKGLVDILTAQKQDAVAAWIKKTSDAMQLALDSGQHYYVEQADPAPAPAAKAGQAVPAFTKPVYVIVPGQCASACLDALDIFTRFPNTTLIGAPSGSDSNYLEVREQTLASGRASVILPLKAYVHRTRASGQGYAPAIYVTDIDWSTRNFLGVVEKDLARIATQTGRP
jgi:hypothetical protein